MEIIQGTFRCTINVEKFGINPGSFIDCDRFTFHIYGHTVVFGWGWYDEKRKRIRYQGGSTVQFKSSILNVGILETARVREQEWTLFLVDDEGNKVPFLVDNINQTLVCSL